MWNRVKEKGIVGSIAHIGYLVVFRIRSLVASFLFRCLGYDGSYSATYGGGNRFFQSHAHHIRWGAHVRFGRHTRIDAGFGGRVTIGDDVLIDDQCFITSQQSIRIGSHVQIAAFSFITDFNHRFDSKKELIVTQGYKTDPVIIEDDVWIGSHVMILPGVKIGKGAVIGAGSVVTHDVLPYTVCAGNPARMIKKRP